MIIFWYAVCVGEITSCSLKTDYRGKNVISFNENKLATCNWRGEVLLSVVEKYKWFLPYLPDKYCSCLPKDIMRGRRVPTCEPKWIYHILTTLIKDMYEKRYFITFYFYPFGQQLLRKTGWRKRWREKNWMKAC